MKLLKKSALALGLAAAVGGMGASVAQAQVGLATDNLGQALIYPYLTANNGWSSFLHVINTSSTYTVAAKVRFHAATDSADAYDFIVVLSPNDMWTGVIEQQGGQVGFRPTDNTCTVPYFGSGRFTPFVVQASEVYAEVIMMGASTLTAEGSVAANAKHNLDTGLPKDCNAVESAFASPASMSGANGTAAQFNVSLINPAANVLTGKYDLANVGLGQAGAGRATVLALFAAVGSPYGGGSGMWSQSPGDWDHPTLAETPLGLQTVNTLLSHTAVINEWVLNPNLGELSSWIVTFPTKKLTVDAFNAINALTAQTTKLPNNFSGCQAVTPQVYNREERPLILASPGGPQLCNEVNVVNFKNGALDSSSVLGSKVAITLDTSPLGSGVLAGWMQLGMPNTGINTGGLTRTLTQTTLPSIFPNPAGGYNLGSGLLVSRGRPVVGFNLTARSTPSDAVLYDHAYRSF
ncbi:MAG: hypothetical protein RKO66_12245 [Candidatus Contendobacter sp.]|nr:hypothetical protein [Candidatus Contendobacter sp.]